MLNMNSPAVQFMLESATPEQRKVFDSVGYYNGPAPRVEQGQCSQPAQTNNNILSGYYNPFFTPQTNGNPRMNNPRPFILGKQFKSQMQIDYENAQKLHNSIHERIKNSIANLRARDEEEFPWLKEQREFQEDFERSVEEYHKLKEELDKKKPHVMIIKGDKILADNKNTPKANTENLWFNEHEIVAIERKFYWLQEQRKQADMIRFNNAIERECDNVNSLDECLAVMNKVTMKIRHDDFVHEQEINHIRRFRNFESIFDKFKDKSRLTKNNMSDEEIMYRTSNTVKAFDDSQLRQFAYDAAFSEDSKKYAKLDENGVLTITAPKFDDEPPMLLRARLAREADGQNLAARKLAEAKSIFLRNIHEAVLRSQANND